VISLAAIEQSLDHLTREQAIEEAMLSFAQEQTAFLQYLQTEGFDLLSQDERDYLQYLVLVSYRAACHDDASLRKLAMIPGGDIERLDEACWEWMQAAVGKSFHDRLDIFFDNIDEEELLAFAEDSMADPEDEETREANLFTSGPSKELGFVTLAVLAAGMHEQLQAGD
jgi:hypothetical protein